MYGLQKLITVAEVWEDLCGGKNVVEIQAKVKDSSGSNFSHTFVHQTTPYESDVSLMVYFDSTALD